MYRAINSFIILITRAQGFVFSKNKSNEFISVNFFQVRSMQFVGSARFILSHRHLYFFDLFQLKWSYKRNVGCPVVGDSPAHPSEFSINVIGDIIFYDRVRWPIDFLFRSHMQCESRNHSIWDDPRFGSDDSEAKQMTKMCCPRVEQRVERTSTDNDKFCSLFQPVFVSKNVYSHAFIYHCYVRNFCPLNYGGNSEHVRASFVEDLKFHITNDAEKYYSK